MYCFQPEKWIVGMLGDSEGVSEIGSKVEDSKGHEAGLQLKHGASFYNCFLSGNLRNQLILHETHEESKGEL